MINILNVWQKKEEDNMYDQNGNFSRELEIIGINVNVRGKIYNERDEKCF